MVIKLFVSSTHGNQEVINKLYIFANFCLIFFRYKGEKTATACTIRFI